MAVLLSALLSASCGSSNPLSGATPTNAPTGGEFSCGWPVAPHAWCNPSDSADKRATLLLAAMSQQEKIDMLLLKGSTASGIPNPTFQDGPVGAGGALLALPGTAMPSGTALGASFDRALARQYGTLVGQELKNRGNEGILGPNTNLVRVPMGGRSFETFGEEPYLSSEIVVPWIQGAQSLGFMAVVKHFVADNQEGIVGSIGAVGSKYYANAIMDERALHEVHLLPFEAAVRRANAASVMCSFNMVNGAYVCENPHLLLDVLRGLWGFQGFVFSDAFSDHETASNLNSGMNVSLIGQTYQSPQVQAALASGRVTQETFEQRVFEILRALFAHGVFDRDPYVADVTKDDLVAGNALAEQVAVEGATLLKNDGTLPIDISKVHTIAVIGVPANRYVNGRGSAGVTPSTPAVTVLDGIMARAVQDGIAVSYNDGVNLPAATAAASAADLAIVVAATLETEGHDRLCLELKPQCGPEPDTITVDNRMVEYGDQDALIQMISAANPATVVVLQTGAPVLTPWREGVAALLEAWFPGQAGGSAVAKILFGDMDPGGRLPMTFPDSADVLFTAGDPEAYPGVAGNVHYKEGVMIGYRYYDLHNITPAFPLGYGLSYTTFNYGSPTVLHVGPGGADYSVTVTITNSGSRSGWAVPQVYVGMPSTATVPQPLNQLKGFSKLQLQPGESRRVSIPLDARSFSYWDATAQDWRLVPGCHDIRVGSSSRDLALAGVVAALADTCMR